MKSKTKRVAQNSKNKNYEKSAQDINNEENYEYDSVLELCTMKENEPESIQSDIAERQSKMIVPQNEINTENKTSASTNENTEQAIDDPTGLISEPKSKKDFFKQALKFLLFSITAGVIQIVTFTLMNEFMGVTYWPAYLTSLVLSVLYNFTLNRKFTFKAHNNIPLAMFLVACYYAVFTPLSTLWGDALTNIGWNEYIVLGGTMVINFVTEFLFQKYVVYRKANKKVEPIIDIAEVDNQ